MNQYNSKKKQRVPMAILTFVLDIADINAKTLSNRVAKPFSLTLHEFNDVCVSDYHPRILKNLQDLS